MSGAGRKLAGRLGYRNPGNLDLRGGRRGGKGHQLSKGEARHEWLYRVRLRVRFHCHSLPEVLKDRDGFLDDTGSICGA